MNKIATWLFILALAVTSCTAPVVTQQQAAGTRSPAVEISLTRTVIPPLIPATTSPVPTSPLVTATLPALPAATRVSIDEVIEFEMKGAFDFFWEQANTDPTSPGYGLIRDRYPGSEGISSIASVGFGLTAYPIGIEKGYITHDQGYERTTKTLDTLLKLERNEGFYYHFLDIETGLRAWDSEVSDIDTAILMMGVLSAGQYFGGEIESKAIKIYEAVNWPWYVDPKRDMFYMAYRPEKGFEGHWDFYAEQLMLYVLAAGSKTHPTDDAPYYTFTRHWARYGNGQPFIHSWFGTLFTYQFSHAWIDFKGYKDREGVNWFDNSVQASLAQVQFATDMQGKFKTLSPLAWGLTACDGPNGYNGTYGAPPSGFDNTANFIDDTIPPAGAIGSIIFVPEQTKIAMLNYYSIDKLKGSYGFYDAYNLSENWFDRDVIGIDKGISLLMLANYQGDTVHKIMMENEVILRGLEVLVIAKE